MLIIDDGLKIFLAALFALALCFLGSASSLAQGADPLPSWNEGATK